MNVMQSFEKSTHRRFIFARCSFAAPVLVVATKLSIAVFVKFEVTMTVWLNIKLGCQNGMNWAVRKFFFTVFFF